MRTLSSALVLVVLVASAPVHAESEEAPQAKPAAKAQPARAESPTPRTAGEPGKLVNVRIDLTITNQKGSEPPVTKALALTVADRQEGMLRSETETPFVAGRESDLRTIPLHVDAAPVIQGDKVRLRFSLSYRSVETPSAVGRRVATTEVRETLAVVLDSGKPMVVAQSADPVADRRISVEVKATILR